MNREIQDGPEDLRLREQLQRAVRSQDVPPYLEARIRANLQPGPAARPFWNRQWAAAAAALIVMAGGTAAYRLGHLRLTAASQDAYIASVSNRVATLMRAGLGDHIHCAYFRKFPKTPPPMEEFVRKMGPEYTGLIPVVRKQIPEQFRLETAHQCRYHDRKFVHIVLKDDSKLISLVVARKQPGESFETEGLMPALAQSGLSMYRSGVQYFKIASFESRDHLIYLISDLPDDQNMNHLLAMAPAVKEVLAKIEL
jgi:hypothetical protein